MTPTHPHSGADVTATAQIHPSAADPPRWKDDLILLGAVALVAILGRLPAFGAWWALDDWGLLARGAGLDAAPAGLQARWLSQHLWWQLTWSVFGLNADAQTVVRLALHAISALLVVRLGARLGLGRGGRLVAGLLFTSSPLVFTNVYWASNIQELLGLTFALAGLEFWLAGSRGHRLAGALLLLASFLSKETGLGLPVLLAVLLAVRERRAAAADWMLVLFLALAAAMEAVLVMRHFATGPGDPYEVGGPSIVLRNLSHIGWYLLAPRPIHAHVVTWPMILSGLGLFVAWTGWAGFAWRRSDRRPALLLLACLLALAPLMPLSKFIYPYLATPPMTVFVLALGLLVPRRWSPRPVVILGLVVAATVWSLGSMRVRLGNRNELGFPADTVVRATSLSWQSCRMFEQLRWPPEDGPERDLVLLQVPVSRESLRDAARLGERWVSDTEMYRVLEGTRGAALVLGPEVRVSWVNALTAAPAAAMVLCEEGTGFKVWGPLPQAALYAALTDVGLGEFERARLHLVRAAAENPETVGFVWDEGLMVIPLEMVLKRKEAFVDWTVTRLADRASSLQEVGGLQDMFLNLLEVATGLSREELTAGGHYITGPAAAAHDSLGTGP